MFDDFFSGAAGGIISGIGSLIGGNQTNQAAADRAESAQNFSAQQYATRYQTTVKDLEAAGLNPMLAYSQGPGTSPTGVQAPVSNALGGAMDSYNKGKATSAQSALQQEQSQVAKSQVTMNSATTAKVLADAEVSKEQAELLKVERLKKETEVPKIVQETKTSQELAQAYIQQAGASAAQAAKAYEEIKNISQQNQNLRAELQRIQQNNDQTAPESEIAKKYPTFYYLFHKLIPSVSGSAGNLSRFLPR
ncbi:MAG: DNA pilot protein [Arizlama microvirus]|nr:MAG: DNA pilot protein [Arizlama microvirus]